MNKDDMRKNRLRNIVSFAQDAQKARQGSKIERLALQTLKLLVACELEMVTPVKNKKAYPKPLGESNNT